MTLEELATELVDNLNKSTTVTTELYFAYTEYKDYNIEDIFEAPFIYVLETVLNYMRNKGNETSVRVSFGGSVYFDILVHDDLSGKKATIYKLTVTRYLFALLLSHGYLKRIFRTMYDETFSLILRDPKSKNNVNSIIHFIVELVLSNRPMELKTLLNTDWTPFFDEFIKINKLRYDLRDRLPTVAESFNINKLVNDKRVKESFDMSIKFGMPECTAVLLRWFKKNGVETTEGDMEL